MTKLLSEAFQKAASLSEELQNQLAQDLIEELEWDRTLAGSQDQLDQMADEAEKEFRSGKTKEMGFDEL